MKTNNITQILLYACALVFLSCGVSSRENSAGADVYPVIDSLPGTCPYLAKDTEGNLVLSWVRNTSDSTAVFCYAVSIDEGQTFGPANVIPSSTNVHPHSENIPKVVFKPSGEIIAVWGAANPNPMNKYSGMVFYSQSFDKGKTWNKARPLVNDTTGFDQRYFDMALLPDGEVAITWLDNRKTEKKEGSALYFARTNGKDGFVNERNIQQGCCQCCRTDLFVDNSGGIHVLYRGILNDGIRDMVHTISNDSGITFTEPKRISADNWVLNACPHTGPAMAENSEGLHFAWYTGQEPKGSYYTRSTNKGESFSDRESINVRGSHPQITALQSGELVIVWDETAPVKGALQSRIGVQKRSKEGRPLVNTYLSEDSLRVSYPVVTETRDRQTFLSFCRQQKGKSFVVYKRTSI